MQIKFDAPAGQWLKATGQYERIMAQALTKGMKDVGDTAKSLGNRIIHGAGFASRKWELRAINYPKSGYSLLPEVWVHSGINFEDVFETGAAIHGSPFLWLPLPSVPLWPGDSTRQMSPKKFVQTFGPVLVTIRRPGKPPMLGQKIKGPSKAQPFGAFATRAQLRRGIRSGSGTVRVIPLFVGVPFVTLQKRFDVQPAMQKARDMLPQFYLERLEVYEGRR